MIIDKRKRSTQYCCWLLLTLVTVVTADDVETTNYEGPPVITEHPLDVIVAKGEPATLNCAARNASEFLWYKDGESVVTAREETKSHRLVLNNGALFLLRVNNGKDADSGTYYCVARNKYGETRSREAVLKIAMLRDDFRTRPRNVEAIIGGRTVLECSPPKGFPEPTVFWKKDDRELRLDDDTRITLHPSGNLVIDGVQRSDSGFYQCVASNMVGEKISNPARLSVYEKPRFLQRPEDVTSEISSRVLLACRVSGDPMPTIVWKKKEGRMPSGRAKIEDGRGLRLDGVVPSDEGEYICQARNAAGSIEASARLIVHAPPSFDREPVDQTVEEGAIATFQCQAVGNPLPARFWSKEGQQELMFPGHVSSDGRMRVSTDGELIIRSVRASDHGYYVCSALNAAGSNVAKAMLKVSGRVLTSYPPPIIDQGHANQTLTLHSSAILPCQAHGQSVPQISWLKDGQPLALTDEDSSRFSQLTTGSLQITNLDKSDTGMYTCSARNENGESTWTAYLTVEEHTNPIAIFNRMPDAATFPSAPGQPTILNVTDESVSLTWTAPEKQGASPVIGYILQYFSPEQGQLWLNVPDYIRDSHFIVKNLHHSHSYVFIVRAENTHGIGLPSAVSAIARTKPSIKSNSDGNTDANRDIDVSRRRLGNEQLIKLIEVKMVNATAMKLFWRLKRSESLIQGYYIKWRGPTNSERNWVNVTDANVNNYTVTGLIPYTNYAFFVIPYHRNVQGAPSNSLDGTTDEAPPTSTPDDIRVLMMNLTTLRISWRPPSPAGINGLLRGFQIVVLGNGTRFNRNISTNERAASVTLFHLVPGMVYRVKVAAKTAAGIGQYHGESIVTMDEATLEQHLRLAKGDGTDQQLMRIVKTPWFIAAVGILIWIALMAAIVLVYWRRNKSKAKETVRLSMPFIKINDGSVHMTARDALWMDHANFNTAQRTLLLNNSLNASALRNGGANASAVFDQDGREYYLMDSAPPDYPGLPFNTVNNNHHRLATLERAQSPNHYHYASTATDGAGAMSTFYSMHQDDPSPYATTTLVMGAANRRKWLHDHMLRGPIVPSGPIPSCPPPGFDQPTRKTISAQSDSPPNTDISYVQSSDGTGGSSNGATSRKSTNTNSRRTPKQTLMDFIPPPPPGAPPPSSTATSAPVRRRGEPSSHDTTVASSSRLVDDYDSVSEALLRHHQQHHRSSSPLDDRIRYHPEPRSRPHMNKDININDVDHRRPNNSHSSLMCSTVDNRSCSSEADEELSDDEPMQLSSGVDFSASRPTQPCMGVGATALTQSSYDSGSVLRSTGRQGSSSKNDRIDRV